MRSIRHRLVAVALCAAVACMGALIAVLELVRTGEGERTQQAREAVTRRLDQLSDGESPAASQPPPAPRAGPGWRRRRPYARRLAAGTLDAQLAPVAGDDPRTTRAMPDLAQLAPRARDSDEPVLGEADLPGGRLVIGLVALPDGGFAWAAARVVTPPEVHAWRIGIAVLALASLLLVFASLHTLVSFQRGARSLQDSVSALARDLGTPVGDTGLRELDEVAGGIAAMARELSGSEHERDRLRAELAERERLASLGRVVAGVAHEVRNPLASIKLRADLAGRAADTPPALAADLAEIAGEVSRLDRLVADLLVVAGRRKGPRAEADLGELCRKRAALMAPWAAEREVTVRVEGAARASVDADGLARAVDNLVRNAVEASPRGAEVHVEVAEDARGATVTVRDQGGGVPPERARELFEPFFTTKSDGTGLGLALSRTVAVAHGGTLTYRRDGGRTCFALFVPRANDTGSGAAPPERGLAPSGQEG